MKLGVVTTLKTNIGDDLIRDGLFHVLASLGYNVYPVLLNKHRPGTLYPQLHPINWPRPFTGRYDRLYIRLVDAVTYRFGYSIFDSCDAILQAGTPVYFPYCASTEWSRIVWEHALCRLASRVPVMNLAAGSCYSWERIPWAIPPGKDRRFVETITSACRVTTVRDTLAQRLLAGIGFTVEQIPCAAFLAARRYKAVPSQTPEFVFFNYMRKGTHFDFEQGIDEADWEKTMRKLVSAVKRRHRIAFICHNEEEWNLAERIDGTAPRFLPRTVADYLRVASRGVAGLFNRMHAAVGFAGLGIPSIGVGGDSRMLMVDALGLPTTFVKTARFEPLEDILEGLIRARREEQERLLALQERTVSAYARVVEAALGAGLQGPSGGS